MTKIVERLLDELHARPPLRAGSLIVTVFGDLITPRGGRLALSSLIEIIRAFRVNEGVVRTALSRLVADGWFDRERVGRKSFYRLTSQGRATFMEATDKIYGAHTRAWEGSFDLVVLDPGGDRSELRAALETRGYGALTPDVLIAPGSGDNPERRVVHFSASPKGDAVEIAARAWPIQDLGGRYKRFVETFVPAYRALSSPRAVADLDALVLRVLTLHAYRRIILRDPLLPTELLPADWPGTTARRVCGGIYRAVVPGSERWLDANGLNDDGPLPPAGSAVRERFRDVPTPDPAGLAYLLQ
jgi:phenylacetic acid degradation operon negative regulatory protein